MWLDSSGSSSVRNACHSRPLLSMAYLAWHRYQDQLVPTRTCAAGIGNRRTSDSDSNGENPINRSHVTLDLTAVM